MEALDSLSRAADTSRGSGTDVCGRHEGISLRRVPTVGVGQLLGIDAGLGCTYAPGRLECADGVSELWVDEPVARRHRRAVTEQRGVGDDDWLPTPSPDHDLEVSRWLSAEQSGEAVLEALLDGNAVPVTGGAMVVEDTEPGGSSTAAEGETGGWSPGSPA